MARPVCRVGMDVDADTHTHTSRSVDRATFGRASYEPANL
jgi:hypothetical protein